MKSILVLLSLVFAAAVEANAAETVRLKLGREIYASYESATGISGHDAELMQLFKLNIDRLPKFGRPDELSNSVVLAATELGGTFCKKALAHEMNLAFGQRLLFSDVDFNRGPSQLNDFIGGSLLDSLAIAFWQRSPTDTERQVLMDMLVAAAQDAPDTPAETVNTLQILCTTYSTSLGFLLK